MEPLTIIPESELRGHKLITTIAIIAMLGSIIPWLSMIYLIRENDRLETQSFSFYLGELVQGAKIDRMQENGCFERFTIHPVVKGK